MRTQSSKTRSTRSTRSTGVIASARKAVRGAAKKLKSAARPGRKISASAKRTKSTGSRRANMH